MYTVEEFDKEKTRVLKYIMYKKRSEHEVRVKFAKTIEENLLDDIIEYLKEAKYINDDDYIDRVVQEFMALKKLSLKELKYKILAKGINKDQLEDYMCKNQDILEEYEYNSAKSIAIKKSVSEPIENIKNYLHKKGYSSESINKALEEI